MPRKRPEGKPFFRRDSIYGTEPVKASDFRFTEEQRVSINELLRGFTENIDEVIDRAEVIARECIHKRALGWNEQPSRAKQKDQLEKAARALQAAAERLEGLPHYLQGRVGAIDLDSQVESNRGFALQLLITAKELPKTTGRPPLYAEREAAYELADLWEQETGYHLSRENWDDSGEDTGPFHRFFQAVIRATQPPPQRPGEPLFDGTSILRDLVSLRKSR